MSRSFVHKYFIKERGIVMNGIWLMLMFFVVFVGGMAFAAWWDEDCQNTGDDAQERVNARVLAIQRGEY